ncbi:putative pentatricopeptide repeat-containing protein At3g01580 [Malania oleifera]|uniref:putative pentatricopeptide repeat-containing protein At3g01580 n=1 Tax=Malania oleifera TaxID=397392 RepID=UPI0025AE8CF5|nr:putative pentatricopeptide repeat-containing protein At3g01580 [Malania oleifera]
MHPSFRNAYNLFEKITHRSCFMRSSMLRFYYTTMCNSHAYLEDPVELFGEKESVISWTSKISGLVRKSQPEEAIHMFKMMLLSENRPNYVTVLSLIKAVDALNCEDMVHEIHGLVIKMGLELEISVVTLLLCVYSVWDLEIVWKLFDQIPNKDLVLWSAMVSVCVKSGQFMEAFEFFREMQYCGMQPNYVSIVSILPGCADVGGLSLGKQIHGFSIKKEFYSHTNVQNSLLDMYAKCRRLEASIRIFNGIQRKDLISWKMIIWGCIENGCPRKALLILLNMLACTELDEIIVHDAILACLQAEEVKLGPQFHCYTIKNGFLAFVSVCTTLLQMYGKFGQVSLAMKLFDQLHSKDLIAWSAMISTYAQSDCPCNALDAFKQMQLANEKPNEITFVGLLQACSSMGAQELVRSIQSHMTKSGYLSNPFLSSALIDSYCKFGRVNQGRALFNEIPYKDLVCWSSMINGYGLNGCGDEALETFLDMLDGGIEPNEIVFISVLSACSHCGLEHEGWNWFCSMKEKYGITPKLAHYACMVDLLSRRGNVEEALEFVKKMPMEPDKRIWGALLAGCRSAGGSLEIAELVANRLIGLDPKNTSYYMILSNLYAEQGKWEDVERMRKLVDEKGLKKTTGSSMIEVN